MQIVKNKVSEELKELKMVCFAINKEEYAIDIYKIVEIIYFREITSLPDAPDFIEGVVDLRGVVIPVIDLKKRLNLKNIRDASPGHILIVRADANKIGILVDEVKGVLHIWHKDIQIPQKVLKGVDSIYIKGVCKRDNSIIVILDIDTILSSAEIIIPTN
ncbi:MAG: chemotaxis protein CheW [Nitrospirota bacterium]